MRVFAGSDHAGFALRGKLVQHLRGQGHDVTDLGPPVADRSDYPDYAVKVGRSVRDQPGAVGLLVCGSGLGMCMAANKVRGVRAVDAWSVESARLSRAHNDANVLCLGERLVSETEATTILDTWLKATFEGGRHVGRLDKIHRIETEEAATRKTPDQGGNA